MADSAASACFVSSLFSSSAVFAASSSAFLSSDWPAAALFASLARQLKRDQFEWDVLLAIKQLMLADGSSGDTVSTDDTAAAGVADMSRASDEDDEDEDESGAAEVAAQSNVKPASSSAAAVDELLIPSSRRDMVDPLTALPSAQSRAFHCLAALIREQLTYLPTAAAMPPTALQAAADDGSSGASSEASSASSASSPVVPSPPPISRPRDGDVLGLFLISLLSDSPSLPFAQSAVLLLELLGSLTNLKLTIRKLLDIVQKPLHVQLPPNVAHTPLEQLDLSALSQHTFLTQHLAPSALLPVLITSSGDSSDAVARFHLRPLIFRLLSAILTQSLASSSSLTALSPEPAVWYQFTDTPLFPKVSKVLPPAATSSASSAAVPSIHTHGYTWHTWLSLTGRRDAPNNVFRFFNDTGFGLQVHVKEEALAVRTLPNTAEAIILKGGELREGEWVHVAVTHKPLARPTPPPQATPVASRRGFPTASPSFASAASPPPSHTGVFVQPSSGSPAVGPYHSVSSPISLASPTSAAVAHNTRPGRLTLYFNGQPVSVSDVPYPNLEQTDNLQCTLGGLYGRMAAFYLLADELPADLIASLYAIGGQQYAVPAMHVLQAGLIAVFPPPPSFTSSSAAASSHQPLAASSAAVAPNNNRTVARCLMAQSPAQTTHSVCLPATWTDDNQPAAPVALTPLTQPTAASTSNINQCLHHTLRLDGTTVVYRTQNAQTLAVMGGLKLLVLFTSPSYCGAPYSSEEELCELILLLAGLVLSSESHAHLLLEIGAATMKQLYLDHCKRRHRTVRLLAAVRRLLLAVNLVDLSADRAHFASFTSAFLLDFSFWGHSALSVQSAAVRLFHQLLAAVPSPFLSFASLGVARVMDNLLVLNHKYIVPPTLAASSSVAPSTLVSPTHAAVGQQIATEESGVNSSSSLTSSAEAAPAAVEAPLAVPSAEESAISSALLDVALELSRSTLSSHSFERDVIAPFLHVVQSCLPSPAASVHQLLLDVLTGLLSLIALDSERILTYLHSQQQAHYVFLRLLYSDTADIRCAGLRLLAHLNVYLVRQEQVEKDKKVQVEYNQLQADIAQAIIAALRLYHITEQEHAILWDILMGQPPKVAQLEADSSAGQHMEAGVAFCHPAYLSMVLELTLLAPLASQSKVLVDVLTLLRTNSSNVDGLAALFWQRLLLPFSSRMHHNPALAEYSMAQLGTPSSSAAAALPLSPSSSSSAVSPAASPSSGSASPSAGPDDDGSAAPAVTPHTIDQLIVQIVNVMLLSALLNDPKGWQVLDQCVWCLQEKHSVLANMPPQVQQTTGQLTLARSVHDTWLLEIAILQRLIHTFSRHLKLLAGRRTDSVAAFKDSQVNNLRLNMHAVLELTEWIVFHSPCSFLTAPTLLALGVPDADKLPVATRADNHMDDATRDEAIREMLKANRDSQASSTTEAEDSLDSNELPGGERQSDSREVEESESSTTQEAESVSESADGNARPAGAETPKADQRRSLSFASTSSLSSVSSSVSSLSFASTASSAAAPAAVTSSATILRASQRSSDEPLSAEEVQILSVLLSALVEHYPMPDKRQDVLRIAFRYLMVVLPHPLCAPLTPHICEMTRVLFCERITERVEKNSRLVALSLSLLKSAMEAAMRRQEVDSVTSIKRCIGQLYHAWGPLIFLDNFAPAVHQSQWAAPTAAAAAYAASALSIPRGTSVPAQQPQMRVSGAELHSPSASPSTVLSAPHSDSAVSTQSGGSMVDAAAAASSSPPPADPIDESSEAALLRLYQGDGRAVMLSTQNVFLQHQQRFSYLSEVRAAKVNASIVDYLRRLRVNEANREKKFSRGSVIVLRQQGTATQASKVFLLQHYSLKRGRPVYRMSEKEEKQSLRVNKAVKQFKGQVMNSRPLPLPLPASHPDLQRSHLASVKAALDAHPPPPAYSFASRPSLSLLLSHSRLVEYWKLDSTEAPTRMRKLLKKNFTSGNPHTFASANATANAYKRMEEQMAKVDLTKVKLTAVKADSSTDSSTAVAAEQTAADSLDEDKEKQSAEEREKLLAEAEEDEAGDDEDEEGGERGEVDADDVDDEADDGSGAKVKRSGKVLLTHFATMITPTHKFIGLLRITQTAVAFSGVEHIPALGTESSPPPTLRTGDDESGAGEAGRRRKAKVREKHVRWSLRQFRIVFPRHFLLRESALEFFLSNFKNYFFHFTPLADDALPSLQSQSAYTQLLSSPVFASRFRLSRSGREQRNEVYRLLCRLLPDMQFELSPGRRLVKSGLTKQWQRGEVSNFDYLMHINTLAGRSYNDINQYPVFPWVLTDYKSESIDLSDPAVYRDLSKPIGALNEDRFEIFNERYQSFEDESIPPFLYGSHYSSAGIALHYLIRCEPFTTLAIQLQGGRFDLPDRLFDSIATSWELSYNNMADVKELIPEFFYQPDFLRNINQLDLGTKQDHTKLGDVVLPPWAATPEEFVRVNREALESEYVSAHLHEWIDLIFGFKQRGRAAHEAQNVFFYLTYAGSVDIDAIDNPALRKATEDQIANFGQTPIQLLTTPHPRRFSAAERSRNGLGHIQLPQRLPASYTSQLICNYQPPTRRKKTGQEERASSSAEEGYQLMLSRVPRMICFTQHDIVIAVDPSMGVQSHSLVAFVASPPSLLYPAHEQMAGIWKTERDAAAATAASSPQYSNGAAEETSDAGRRVKDVRLINRRGAGYLVDSTAPLAPSAAQFVPGSVVSSHLITPMCPHWFLSPTPLPSAAPSTSATPATSSSSAEQKSRALAPHSGSELYHRLVCVPARNARYIFSGGYFDGSLKVHSLLHGRAHVEGEGGMGGGQQSQHVMAALAAKGADPLNLQRPAVRTQNILDCRPLSSVRQHRAVVSALHLSSNSAILLSGDEDGVVCMWRTYLDRQEKTRPPIASIALASFAVHEGPVLSLDTNTVIGVAVSLAMDEQRTRGCDVCVHSIRGGAARFMHNVVVHDSGVDLQMCALTATANIVLYGVRDRVPTLWLYSLNGSLLCFTPTNEVLTVLQCTPTAGRTVNANDGFIVTGGRRGQVVFRHPHNLDMAQTFFTDDHFPHTSPHGLPPPPTQLPVAQAVRSGSAATSDASADSSETAPPGSHASVSATPLSSSSAAVDDWTLVESRQQDAKQRVEAAQQQLADNAHQYPPDPLLESIYSDSRVAVTMGIAAIDVSRTQKHMAVAVFPDPDLLAQHLLPAEHPLAALYSSDSSPGGGTSEGRLLLFSLPFSQDPQSFLGFYVDYASHTLEPLRDSVSAAMFARISDSRDSAIEAVDRARDRMTAGSQQANRKVAEVGKKVFGAFNSIFGGKQKGAASPSAAAAAAGSNTMAAQQHPSSVRGGTVNAPVARAVPRHAPNM